MKLMLTTLKYQSRNVLTHFLRPLYIPQKKKKKDKKKLTRQLESIVCNDEQGDLFCGPTQEPVLATANTGKKERKKEKKKLKRGPREKKNAGG